MLRLIDKYWAGQTSGMPSSAETVEKLVDRVKTCTLLEDRRDAVRALKSLSRKFRLDVGTQAMDTLITVLRNDRSDAEIVGYALDSLCNVMTSEPVLDDDDEQTLPEQELPENIGETFTEMFIKDFDNVDTLLSLLEEYDFYVKLPTVKLLIIILHNRPKEVQECILVSPMGVSKMVDLLSDNREIIRNEGLLLLNHLTKGNANIQKIVAFENAFEFLLTIIFEEGSSDGGIIVEDCLLVLLNLLKNNFSNQNFFKEGSFIQRLAPFMELSSDSKDSIGWSAQKVTNINLMLQVIRTLVSPSNPQQQTQACQKVMHQSGLLQKLCSVLMASGVPADVLTETINAVSEVIRGCNTNQEYFASVMAPSTPPRPAIVVLLMSMVNEKQPFVLRCSVMYCFQSFLYKYPVGQTQIVQTLLPSSADVNTISAGQLLCGGLFSPDTLSSWFAAVSLVQAINGNTKEKDQLLRVQLATSLGNPPVSLLQQCMNLLAQGVAKFQMRVGLLMLLCTWLAECPNAVAQFLSNKANVPFLISQISASDGDEQEVIVQGLSAFLLGMTVLFNNGSVEGCTADDLRQIIQKRIGLEMYTDKISHVHRDENYSKAAKRPQLFYKHASEVVFDHEFTRIFKSLESDVLKAVGLDEAAVANGKAQDSTMSQYKDLIRDLDAELNRVRAEYDQLRAASQSWLSEREHLLQTIQQLQSEPQFEIPVNPVNTDETYILRAQVETKDREIFDKDSHIQALEQKLAEMATVGTDNVEPEVSGELVEDLNHQLGEREKENQELRHQLQACQLEIQNLREHLACKESESNQTDELTQEFSDLNLKIETTSAEKTRLQERLLKSNQDHMNAADKLCKLEEKYEKLAEEKQNLQSELENFKKEQDDLLVLMADQDHKIRDYSRRLKELGQEVDEEDLQSTEEDEEDDEEES